MGGGLGVGSGLCDSPLGTLWAFAMPQELELKNLDLAAIIRPGDRLVWGQGSGEPVSLVEKLVEQRHAIGSISAFVGGTVYSGIVKPEHTDRITVSAFG